MAPIDQIRDELAKAIATAIHDRQGELHDIAVAGGDAASGGLLGDVGRLTGIISQLLGDIPIIGNLIGDVADPIDVVEKAGGKFGRGFGFGYLLGYIGWQLMEPLMLPLIHEVNAHTTNQLFDPQTAAMLTAKGIISQDVGRSESSGNGLDNPHFDHLLDGAYNRPALAELLELIRRGQIGVQDASLALTRDGLPAWWLDKVLALQRVLLSPADLALSVLRGETDYSLARDYAAQLGIIEPDFQTLIGNTGEPPGLMQLLEAYRREIIPRDRLERGIKQSRVRDEWIDVVEALRFQRMSAADAVDAAVQGHLDQDQAKAAVARAGLDPADFDVLYENAGSPIGLVEMLELLNRGEMTQAEVIQGIKESHYKDKYIPFILKRRRQLIPYRTINTIVEHGVRDKAWAIKYLMDLGYTQDDADALVATSASSKTVKAKELTEAQILDAYKTRNLTRAQAHEALVGIRYDRHDADVILAVTDSALAQAEQGRAISAVRSSYLADRVTEQDASGELDRLHVLADARDQLLRDWKVEKAGIVKTLTPTEIADAVKYQIWDFDQAAGKLRSLGYSHNDAIVFLGVKLHGLPAGVTAGPPTRTGT